MLESIIKKRTRQLFKGFTKQEKQDLYDVLEALGHRKLRYFEVRYASLILDFPVNNPELATRFIEYWAYRFRFNSHQLRLLLICGKWRSLILADMLEAAFSRELTHRGSVLVQLPAVVLQRLEQERAQIVAQLPFFPAWK